MLNHRHNSIRIIDNLAEITSHHDRQVLEKSLLKTLNELFPAHGLRLFRVREHAGDHELSLLAFCVNNVIVSSDENPKLIPNSEHLSDALAMAIRNEDIELIRTDGDDGWHVIYPAFDSHDEVFAVLVHTTREPPSGNDQRLVYGILRVYANYLALIDRSQRDKLTGLFNRETLDEEITKILVKRAGDLSDINTLPSDTRRRSYAIKYWLGIVDIDHFKAINDTYGHLYGDEVIILVARLMTSGVMREDDIVFRYGGEEFVVLLRAPDETDALRTFERLRQTIEAHRFPQLDQVTVSVGFVEVVHQQSPSDVIGEADEALYYAKHHGRNQVRAFEQLVREGKIKHSPLVTNNDVELF